MDLEAGIRMPKDRVRIGWSDVPTGLPTGLMSAKATESSTKNGDFRSLIGSGSFDLGAIHPLSLTSWR
jgi:hypothetical protein